MDKWTPATEGADFALTPVLEPLAAFRDRMLVISAARSATGRGARDGEVGGDHPRACTAWLTGAHAKMTSGADSRAGISVDQIAAKEFGKYTQLASLEIGSGIGRSRRRLRVPPMPAPITTRSPGATRRRRCRWRTVRARSSSACSATPAPIRRRAGAVMQEDRSILDAVAEDVEAPAREGSAAPTAARSTSISKRSATWSGASSWPKQGVHELPQSAGPIGVPEVFSDYYRLMTDLKVLAWQTDMTRVMHVPDRP